MGFHPLEASRRSASIKPTVMLVLTTVVWGTSFPLIKDWMQAADDHNFPGGAPQAALALIAVRMLTAAGLIAVLFPRLVLGLSAKEFWAGFAFGMINSCGTLLQVCGMEDTSPALSAFFTSLGSPLVPLLGFAMFRTPVAWLTLLGLAVGMGGVWILSTRGETAFALYRGDLLTIGCAVVYAFMIVCLGRWERHARPGHLVMGMLTGTGLPALLLALAMGIVNPAANGWASSVADMLRAPTVLLEVAFLIALPTVLGTYWLTTYQPLVATSRAALIYLLEPVFAALASLAWGLDQVSPHLLAGGALILGGNLLAELPQLRRPTMVPFSDPGSPPPPPDLVGSGSNNPKEE